MSVIFQWHTRSVFDGPLGFQEGVDVWSVFHSNSQPERELRDFH